MPLSLWKGYQATIWLERVREHSGKIWVEAQKGRHRIYTQEKKDAEEGDMMVTNSQRGSMAQSLNIKRTLPKSEIKWKILVAICFMIQTEKIESFPLESVRDRVVECNGLERTTYKQVLACAHSFTAKFETIAKSLASYDGTIRKPFVRGSCSFHCVYY